MQLTFTNQRIADEKRAICAPRLISNQSPRFLSSLTAHMMPILRRIDFYRKIFYTRLTTTITTKNYVDQCMDVLSEAKIGTMNLLCIYFSQLLLLLLQLISINMFSVGTLQNLHCTCIMQCLCMCISILFGKVHVNINLLFVEFEVMHKYNLWKIVFETRFKSKLGFAECSLFPLFVNCCCYFNKYKSYLLKIVNIGNANSGTSSNWLG